LKRHYDKEKKWILSNLERNVGVIIFSIEKSLGMFHVGMIIVAVRMNILTLFWKLLKLRGSYLILFLKGIETFRIRKNFIEMVIV
jgi:hypothetical protein